MRIFRNFFDLPSDLKGAVYAIGNFDGLHCGHRAVIEEARKVAAKADKPLGVLTFDPHPREFFNPGEPSFRLTPISRKLSILDSWEIDFVVAVEFNEALAATTAEDFVNVHLNEDLNASHIVVGHDFAFGRGRRGSTKTLMQLGREHNFQVSIVGAQLGSSGGLFSSRAIRELLQSGRPREAAKLLGRWWSVNGVVIRGERRGRKLGYPTANLRLEEYMQPSLGIYAVWVRVQGLLPWLKGAASLGVRPTFEGRGVVLEVYLLDFSGDLYDKKIEVAFVQYLRPEERFVDIAALKHQMASDCINSEALLGLPEYAADQFSKFGKPDKKIAG